MSSRRLAVATYPFPSRSLSIRDLRVAAPGLPAQFHEIFLSPQRRLVLTGRFKCAAISFEESSRSSLEGRNTSRGGESRHCPLARRREVTTIAVSCRGRQSRLLGFYKSARADGTTVELCNR
jgi:hypothetical protein